MMGQLIFWLSTQPDSNIAGEQWTDFHNTFGLWVAIAVGLTVLATVGLYHHSARVRLVRHEADLFTPFTPMRWLLLAIVPAVVVGFVGWRMYHDRFPDSDVSFAGSAGLVGLYCGALAFLISFGLMLIPGITPPKFKYRPKRIFLRRFKAAS